MGQELVVIAPRGVAKKFDSGVLFCEWVDDMARRVESGELSAATAKTYRIGMSRFLFWLDSQNIGNVGPQAIRQWRAFLLERVKVESANIWLAGVKAFFRWAVSERGLAYDPTAGVKATGRQSGQHKRLPLSDVEVRRVLSQPDTTTRLGRRDRAILYLKAYVGLRDIEIQRARLSDLHSGATLRLYVHGKGRQEADEYVSLVKPEVADAIYSWLAVHPRGRDMAAPLFCGLGNRNIGQPLSLRTIRHLVKGYYKAAGVIDARKTSHSLRHSLVTNLIRHGVNPVKIMSVTRHRSLNTLLSYAHEVDRDDNPAEAFVDYSNGNRT